MSYIRKVEVSHSSKRLSLSKHDLDNIQRNNVYPRTFDPSIIQQNDFLNVLEQEYEKVKRK